MFGFGKKKEATAPAPSPKHLKGLNGSADEIYLLAAADGSYGTKTDLAEGCVEACLQGRPENLRQFFKGYLYYKIENQGHTQVDEGFENLLVKSFHQVVTKSDDPKEAALSLMKDVMPHHIRTALNIVLRVACYDGKDAAAEAALEAGADANAADGKPLLNAVAKNNTQLFPLLYRFHADFNLAAAKADGAQAKTLLLHKSKLDSEKIAAYQEQIAEQQVTIDELRTRIEALEDKPSQKAPAKLIL